MSAAPPGAVGESRTHEGKDRSEDNAMTGKGSLSSGKTEEGSAGCLASVKERREGHVPGDGFAGDWPGPGRILLW